MNPELNFNRGFDIQSLLVENGDRTALEAGGTVITYSMIHDLLKIAVSNLEKSGVKSGVTLALHRENSPYHLVMLLASWIKGARFMPLNPGEPLQVLMERFPVDFLACDGPWDGPGPCILRPDDIVTPHEDMDFELKFRPIDLEQESSVIFTSGSTGMPRGVIHTVGNYLYSALGTIESLSMDESDRWLVSLPLYHVGGMLILVRSLLAGGTSIFPEPGSPEREILEKKPTIISLVPTQLIRLMDSGKALTAMKKMKALLLGGGPSPSWLIDRALDLGLPIMPTYGSTESCAQVTAVMQGSLRDEYHTAGKPLPYREVEIDKNGLILIKGKTLFKSYLTHNGTIIPRDPEGFRTADMGEFDHRGNLVVLGRKDQVFISGGENINPFEIESSLMALENVTSAYVVPVPHREFGMVPWAFISAAAPVDEDGIRASLRGMLPSYKVPKRIITLDGGNTGGIKMSRSVLQARALEISEGR